MKLNTKTNTVVRSPLSSASVNDLKTHEGGKAFSRDAKSELYTLGVNYYAGENTFYEKAADREKRFTALVEQIAVEDPKWIHGFLTWLRTKGNIRTASIMGAAVAVHARLNNPKSVTEDAKVNSVSWNRMIVRDVCQRADEPGEFLAFWRNTYGKAIPQPVKRGLSDAVAILYNEYSYLKYDSTSYAWRFGDVIEMVHAKPRAFVAEDILDEDGEVLTKASKFNQGNLFKLAIAGRHGNATEDHVVDLDMINMNMTIREEFKRNPEVLYQADLLKRAGFTWEDTLSLAGSKLNKGKLWDAIVPNMGIFALVRNLRNFEEAGVSMATRKYVIDQLENPEVIARSKMFPYRFYAAYEHSAGLAYASALETAIGLSVSNVPALPGNSLVLSDISASMSGRLSDKSKMSFAQAAAIFAGAIALKNPGRVEFVGFADNTFIQPAPKGGSLLRLVQDFHNKNGTVGGGTRTVDALRKHFDPKKHDRVFIITDMQAFQDYGASWGYSVYNYGTNTTNQSVVDVINSQAYLYGFSLGGYNPSMLENAGKAKVHELSGLTDSAFQLPVLLERNRDAKWPWEV